MEILSYISQEKDQQHGERNICGPQPVQIRQDASRSHSSVPPLMTPHSEWLSLLEFALPHFTHPKSGSFYLFSIEASSNRRWLAAVLGLCPNRRYPVAAVFGNNALAMITGRTDLLYLPKHFREGKRRIERKR
jgi:hypothetical protein